MGKQSDSKRCLLCMVLCSKPEEDSIDRVAVKLERNADDQVGMMGAVNFPKLQQQLEQVFILRQILGVPKRLCEEILREENVSVEWEGSSTGGGTTMDPDTWFSVCSSCRETAVKKAWKIYQQIVVLERKMGEIRGEVKSRMKEEMLKPENISWTRRQLYSRSEGGAERRIKMFIFPDIIPSNLQEELIFPENTAPDFTDDNTQVDNISNYSDNSLVFDTATSIEKYSSDEDFTKSNLSPSFYKPLKRGRGRPRKFPELKLRKRKRGRGRPRKHPQLKYGSERPKSGRKELPCFSESLPPQTESVDEEANQTSAKTGFSRKRGRGRPPQSVKKAGVFYHRRHYGTLRKKEFSWKVCKECKTRYRSQEEYDAHQEAHEKSKENGGQGEFNCSQCPFPGRDAQELQYHMRIRHSSQARKPRKKYNCTKCSFKTELWKVLKQHIDNEHPDLNKEELGNEFNLTCDVCGQRLATMNAYAVHRNHAHPELEQQQLKTDNGTIQIPECPHCQLRFPSKRALECHVSYQHTRQSRFICDACGKGFFFASALESHKQRHIDKSKKAEFICHLCGLDYYDDVRLKTHIKNIHKDNASTASGEVFKCRYCDATMPFKFMLRRHLETHKEALGHCCDMCDKKYTSAPGLKRHIRMVHTADKEWPCAYCAKSFSCEEYMNDHVKKFCKVKRLQEGESSQSSVKYTIPTKSVEQLPVMEMELPIDININPLNQWQ